MRPLRCLAGALWFLLAPVAAAAATATSVSPPTVVPQYRVFDLLLTNSNTSVTNKFTGVWLNATFAPPPSASGPAAPRAFWGFHDGGDVWHLRYMPDIVGQWAYTWRFSDGSLAGRGSFDCVATGAGKGVIQVYTANPHWFAYNGVTPVFLKSYYNKAGGLTRQDPTWAIANFYQKLVDHGYNHHMSSGFLPVLPLAAQWDGQPVLDGPPAINRTIYTDPSSPSTSMSLDVWQALEAQLGFLNDHDIAVDFFQGFQAQGPDSGRIQFGSLTEDAKRWWVSYVVARLAPFANIAGWVYSWETGGDGDDLHLAKLLRELDPFGHLTTYEDADAIAGNWYNLSDWGFASVETYGGVASHHNMSLQAYRGKPVYMAEGHMLWHSFWEASERVIVSAAWAVTTAAASFSWDDMGVSRITGPYRASQAFSQYPSAVKSMDILADVMVNQTKAFHKLVPADELLGPPRVAAPDQVLPPLTFCMAEKGQQYLVYSDSGQGFSLDTRPAETGARGGGGSGAPVQYSIAWVDAVGGARVEGVAVAAGVVALTPPSNKTHWVALLQAVH